MTKLECPGGENAGDPAVRHSAFGIRTSFIIRISTFVIGACLLTGCIQEMENTARYDPLEPSELFSDRRSARPLVAGTVPRGSLRLNRELFTGRVDGELVEAFPIEITADVLERGGERFNIFCSPCHDRAGTSNGIVVQRGFPKPPALHIERLRQQPPGYLYEVITHGFGRMPSYADQIPVEDRWAIAAWVRTLQFSQHVDVSELPEEDRRRLQQRENDGMRKPE